MPLPLFAHERHGHHSRFFLSHFLTKMDWTRLRMACRTWCPRYARCTMPTAQYSRFLYGQNPRSGAVEYRSPFGSLSTDDTLSVSRTNCCSGGSLSCDSRNLRSTRP